MSHWARAATALALALVVAVASGCDMREQDGQDWVKRVVKETPRIAQLAFQLPTAPVSSYNTTGQYPNWIGEVTFSRFTWTKTGDGTYRADGTADVTPGPGLTALLPPGAQPRTAHVDLTVDFVVHTTPPPIMFLPAGKSLQPSRWTVHRVDGRSVEESGGFVDYRE